MNQRIFITGTDTDCGKTYVSVQIIKSLISKGFRVKGLKPVAAGANWINAQLRNDDAIQLMKASNVSLPYDRVNPYCFASPIAPHIAAKNKHCEINKTKLIQCINAADKDYPSDYTIIEGAGGWCVPLNDELMFSDLPYFLDAKVVLVVGMKLGCLNHAILTNHMLKHSGVKVLGWIANQVDQSMLNFEDNLQTLQDRLASQFLGLVEHHGAFRNKLASPDE